MRWTGKRVAVIGLGVSNAAVVRYLIQQGAIVTGCDRKSQGQLGPVFDAFASLPIELRLGEHYLDDLDTVDALVLTPGMRKDLPQLQRARARGIPITSETQLFFDHCGARIIGITGSSGKTTTTTLVGELLAASGLSVYVGGNIGRPLLDMVDRIRPDQWVVLELSSFQLEQLEASPHIALVTNISPNHLDVHGTMEQYVRAKKRIYASQGQGDWLVLHADDPWAGEMAAEAPGRVRWFRPGGGLPEGVFVEAGRIVMARDTSGQRTLEEVCRLDDIRLLGEHNLANVLSAVAVADLCGVQLGTIRDVVRSFTGVKHRLELVRDVWGVRYYNDSIATTPSRAVAGIRAFSDPIILLAGGYDKGIPFDEMAECIVERVKLVVLMGDTANRIEDAIDAAAARRGTRPAVLRVKDFDSGVKAAVSRARAGDVVLLSPGCASYGMFSNFEERGQRFRRLIHDFTEMPVTSEQT